MKSFFGIHNKTIISPGDIIDLFYKIKEKGFKELLTKFHFSNQNRTISKWNRLTSSSDFWIIPEIRRRWNEKCTGDPNLEYEDYFVNKYLSEFQGLKMLSVGCGTGSRERKFARYPNFSLIKGIDLAEKMVDEARENAHALHLKNLNYTVGDFLTSPFEPGEFDIILFNSSLHHFKKIDHVIRNKILPILKKDGFLVLFEYVGPNRLQWTDFQLIFANKLLKNLPGRYKQRMGSNAIKRRIYRPGLLRMMAVDPSEAVDSESILPSVHNHFQIIEEKKIGWDITHILLKDIAHHFLENDDETKALLSSVFEKEDEYLSLTGRSDVIFGIYQK